MKSDEQWMREYSAGSEDAFGHLYEKYSPMVYAFIKRRMRESEAEDVFQKVWRHLHEKRSIYKDQPFAPWLFVLMRNLIIDEYRSLDRRKMKGIENELVERIYSLKQADPDVEELLLRLPEESRNLVRNYYLEEISYEELEIKTGLSQANLRQRLSRAIRGLRKQYEE